MHPIYSHKYIHVGVYVEKTLRPFELSNRLSRVFPTSTLATLHQATGTGNSSGVTWWAMMNGSLYEESPPPAPSVIPLSSTANLQQQQQQPASQNASTPISSSGMTSPAAAATVPAPAAATTSTTSSTSPSSSVASNNGSTGPLHIPAKRLTSAYGECGEPGVIRHSHHGAQPWNYSPVADSHHGGGSGAFEPAAGLNHHQYANAPTYYNLADSAARDPTRKSSAGLSFWSPAATAAGGNAAADYKYSSVAAASAGPSTDPAVSSCHQSFSAQSWCNYSPYTTSTRHHMDSHHHPHAQYLAPADDRGRVAAAAAMVAAETAAGFTHDGYGLRNYGAPEPVPSTPYPPPGSLSGMGVGVGVACGAGTNPLEWTGQNHHVAANGSVKHHQ
ncbi:hypothetical protein CBL_05269 [Carabus blaptoides fortunei]